VPLSNSIPIAPAASPAGNSALTDRVRRVIDLIRPAIQADGGDIEFVALTPENLVQIRMHGACVGCPSSTVTLQTGIERNLKAHVPEVRGLQAVE
jgi:Fe-S cluster biogenesis protein NfuA